MSDIAKRAGISRQALYLHFKTRAELLVATTHYLDDLKGEEERLVASRTARTGTERLEAFIEAWGNYIPDIYGTVKALLDIRHKDEAAASAWDERMQDMKEGSEAAILALDRDGDLSESYTPEEATDLLWTLLSVRNWEHLILDCDWPQERYIAEMKAVARRLFVTA